MPSIHQFFYISELVPGGSYTVVGAITNVARERNSALGITGALLFDGERFCQLLEGQHSAVEALAGVIIADRRHRNIRVLHDGPSVAGARFSSWLNGYCGVDELDVFGDGAGAGAGAGDAALRGPPAVDAFVAMLARCDLRA